MYLRPTLRRLASLAAAAIAGTAAALVMASPASAHHTSIEGKFKCLPETSQWEVTWTVSSHDTPANATEYKLVEIVADPASPAITWAPAPDTFQDVDENFVGTVRLPSSAAGATLAVKARWNNNHVERKPSAGKVTFEGTCAAKPAASFSTDCTGAVTVTLVNTDGTADARFTVTGQNGFVAKRTVAAGEDDKVTVPAANSAEVTVTEESDKDFKATGMRAVPGSCGNLPVTGVKAGAAAAGAAGLVGLGVALFLVARRRRIRFTA